MIDAKVLVAIGAGLLLLYLLREHLTLKEDFREVEKYIFETYHQMAAARSPQGPRVTPQQKLPPRASPVYPPGTPAVQPRNIPQAHNRPVVHRGPTRMPPMHAMAGDNADDILSDISGAPIMSSR